MAATNDGKIKPIANILVVDDDPDIVEVIKRGLEQNNFLVSAFTSSVGGARQL